MVTAMPTVTSEGTEFCEKNVTSLFFTNESLFCVPQLTVLAAYKMSVTTQNSHICPLDPVDWRLQQLVAVVNTRCTCIHWCHFWLPGRIAPELAQKLSHVLNFT